MTYHCKPCRAKFSTKPERNDHERNCPMRIGEEWECSVCHLTYAAQKSRDRHENDKHLNPQIFRCSQCYRNCQRKDSLQDHVRHFHSAQTSNSESAAMASTPAAVPAVAGQVASRKRASSAAKASTPPSKKTTAAAGSLGQAKRTRSCTDDLNDRAPAAASSTTPLPDPYTLHPFETSLEPPTPANLSFSSSSSSMAAPWGTDIGNVQDRHSSETSSVQLTPVNFPALLSPSPIAWDMEPYLDLPEGRQLAETSSVPPMPVNLSSSSSPSTMAAFPWEATDSDNNNT